MRQERQVDKSLNNPRAPELDPHGNKSADLQNTGNAHVEARIHKQGMWVLRVLTNIACEAVTFVKANLEEGNVSYRDVLGEGVWIPTNYLLDRDFAEVVIQQHFGDV